MAKRSFRVTLFCVAIVGLVAAIGFPSLIPMPPLTAANTLPCSIHDPVSYNLSADIKITESFNKLFLERQAQANENGGKAFTPFSLPLFISRMRYLPSQLYPIRDVATDFLSTVDRDNDSWADPIVRLRETLESASATEFQIRTRLFRALTFALSTEKLSFYLNEAGFRELEYPKSIRNLITLAAKPGPDAILYQGLINSILASEVNNGATASLSPRGFEKLNRQRVLQDLLFLGDSCWRARAIAAKIPTTILRQAVLPAAYGLDGVTYSVNSQPGATSYKVRYPDEFKFIPKLAYTDSRPGKTPTSSDLQNRFAGQYEVTDFAYGSFNNVTMHLRGFYVLSVAMNLIRQYPAANFVLKYNPNFFSSRGISDLPAYFMAQLSTNGLPTNKLTFVVDQSLLDSGEGVGYSWTRDMWLNATSRETMLSVKLSNTLLNGTDEITKVPVAMEGGAIFPIGGYFFVNKQIWNQYSDDPADTVEARADNYRRLTGRQPIFIGQGLENYEPVRSHVDTYMIFLPQRDGRVVIGLPDFDRGSALYGALDEKSIRNALRDRFLTAQFALRVAQDQRASIDTTDPSASGLPMFLSLPSFHRAYGLMTFAQLSETNDLYDVEAAWLKSQGFEVFRYPGISGALPANGFVEVTQDKATFTTSSFGYPLMESELAKRLGEFGYSLFLIPAVNGVSEGAGLHCLTNENRL